MRYKLFGKSGLKVSELCLGAMTFGEDWGTGADYNTSKQIFESFAEAGGNFIDTANFYTNGTSEKYLGDFVGAERDKFVLASKYTLIEDSSHPNGTGNSRRNMMRTVEASLKRMNTDYMDVLWVHMWDGTTSVDEILRAMNDLISQGKVGYIGISDTPAWVVSQANTMAILRGWEEFVGLQVEYSLIARDVERELIPMADHFGMSVTTWSPLGAGLLSGKYNKGMIEGSRLSEKSVKFTPKNIRIAESVVSIAQKLGKSPAQVALNWLRAQNRNIIPILGARKVDQLKDNLNCVDWNLEQLDLDLLEGESAIDLGFPTKFLSEDTAKKYSFGGWYDKIDKR
ncbi:aldo/keto reductase [Flammeovirga kamogawensis]|uniref:Aldo/keto reductase n=1 Tax=Flammeovirga kamogawensis TaxID=373891 RepID=A0ABX8GWF8_9BACT|nr:aldo/keto reductase [Flammeovirga kamogawensis]MBB6461180.1 aryl-alcohol dehydrogenase-like predicted oxidoreductase [Flammeovirga kamogawensis]QWG07744.1 aldo/keto reductase [Flammeovirga kamogawensis]TRX69550.1 aldo/keto reductase [Flammeovirga kamogawensis]